MPAFRRLILPSIFILLALFMRQHMVSLYNEYGQLFDWLPYFLIMASFMLANFFQPESKLYRYIIPAGDIPGDTYQATNHTG